VTCALPVKVSRLLHVKANKCIWYYGVENPAACEVRAAIRILNVNIFYLPEIPKQIAYVYGEGTMNECMRGNGVGCTK